MFSCHPGISFRSPASSFESPGLRVHSPGLSIDSPGMFPCHPAISFQSPGRFADSPGLRADSPTDKTRRPDVSSPTPAFMPHARMFGRHTLGLQNRHASPEGTWTFAGRRKPPVSVQGAMSPTAVKFSAICLSAPFVDTPRHFGWVTFESLGAAERKQRSMGSPARIVH